MNRRYTKETLELVHKLKDAILEYLSLQILLSVSWRNRGRFEDTLDIVSKVKFDSAFTFYTK